MLAAEKPSYRPDIDGLRAIAVLGVLMYHFGITAIPGGFTGVDVFFVISGFLITQILKREISSGSFSLVRFYQRRIRRILPALVVVLITTLAAGWFLLLPGSYQAAAESGVYASLGLANIFFFFNTGYFDELSETQVFLHTWSLGVEEQYYFVWPVLLLGIFKLLKDNRARTILIATMVTLGAIYAAVAVDNNPKAAFYLPFARAWELGLGALLAFLPPLRSKLAANVLSLVGVSLVAYSMLALDSSVSFPGLNAAYACVGATLIMRPAIETTLVARILSWRPIVGVGLISYSLYLWHWPILVLYRNYINGAVPAPHELLSLATICLLIAYLSWRFVEGPFRRPSLSCRRVTGVCLGGAAATILIGVMIAASHGAYSRLPPEAAAMSSKEIMWQWDCPEIRSIEGLPEAVCIIGADWANADKRAVLWGDSHAAHLAPFLDPIAREKGYSVILYDKCAAMFGSRLWRAEPEPRRQCDRFNPAMLEYLNLSDIESVFFAGYWDVLPGIIEPTFSDPAGEMVKELNAIIATLGDKQFYLLTDIPTYWSDRVECANVGRNGLWRRKCEGGLAIERATFEARSAAFRHALANNPPDALVVDIGEPLCPSDQCTAWIGDEYIYRDSNHLRRNLSTEANLTLSKIMGLDRLFPEP